MGAKVARAPGEKALDTVASEYIATAEDPASQKEHPLARGFLDSSLHYLAARVAHRIGRRFYHRHLKPRGIRAAEWWVLTLLEEKDRLSISTIASHIFYDQPATTRLVERMVESGLVQRRSSNSDRRKVIIQITNAGRKKVSDLEISAAEDEQQATRSFKKSELEALKGALRLVLKDLGMAETVDESQDADISNDAA